MLSQPDLEFRAEQHYASILFRTSRDEIPAVLPTFWREVHASLSSRRLSPTAAPFIRHVTVVSAEDMEVEACVPLALEARGEPRVRAGVLPEGWYATMRHSGSIELLRRSNEVLDAWAQGHGLLGRSWRGNGGIVWGARTETFPDQDPASPTLDVSCAEIAFLLQNDPREIPSLETFLGKGGMAPAR